MWLAALLPCVGAQGKAGGAGPGVDAVGAASLRRFGGRLGIGFDLVGKERREDNWESNKAVELTAVPGRFRDHKP
jgi:hypothetical protein